MCWPKLLCICPDNLTVLKNRGSRPLFGELGLTAGGERWVSQRSFISDLPWLPISHITAWTIPPHSHLWKTWLPWHWSLVPERLGTPAQKHFACLSTLSKEMWRESAFPLCSSRDAPTHSDNFKADWNDSVNQQWCSRIQKLPRTIQNHECFLLLTLSRANAVLEYLGVVYLRYECWGKRWSVASFSPLPAPSKIYVSFKEKRLHQKLVLWI